MPLLPTPPCDDYVTLEGMIASFIEDPSLLDEETFDSLALRVFALQFERNEVYRRFCEAAGRTSPASWRDIPALPTEAFKRAEVRSFSPADTMAMFETSGTTRGEGGRHYFRSLRLYEAAIVPEFRTHLMGAAHRLPMFMLTPTPAEAPRSSLVHMMKVVGEHFAMGAPRYYVSEGRVRLAALIADIEECSRAGQPVMLLGTAFALAAFVETLAAQNRRLPLAAGSRIMETGGFKGRHREIPRPAFYAMMADLFGVPLQYIVNEYGMTELSSQFYDTSLRDDAPTAIKSVPAWTRVVCVDPATGREVDMGARGLIRIEDLANLGSVIALQTEDVGVRHAAGRFEVLGRVAAAPPRGCSLDAEDLETE